MKVEYLNKAIFLAEKNGFDFNNFALTFMSDIENPRKMIVVPCFTRDLLVNNEFLKCFFNKEIKDYEKKNLNKLTANIINKIDEELKNGTYPFDFSKIIKKKCGRPKGSKNKKKKYNEKS